MCCNVALSFYPHLLPFFLPPQGVIAAQKITASSPDTDLPTVMGLRVRSPAFGMHVWEHLITKWSLFLFLMSSNAENGGEHDDQQQGDRQQERRALSSREASHHPLRPGRDWARYWGPPPHCVLCCRCHHQLHREGQSSFFLTNSVKVNSILFSISASFQSLPLLCVNKCALYRGFCWNQFFLPWMLYRSCFSTVQPPKSWGVWPTPPSL